MAQYDVNKPDDGQAQHTFNHTGYKIVASQAYSFTLGAKESVILGANVSIKALSDTSANLGFKHSFFLGAKTDVNVSYNLSYTSKRTDVKLEDYTAKGIEKKVAADHKAVMADKMSAVLGSIHLINQHLQATDTNVATNVTNIATNGTNLDATNTRLDTTNTRIDTTNTHVDEVNARMDTAQVHMGLNSMCIRKNQIDIQEAETLRMLESPLLMLD